MDEWLPDEADGIGALAAPAAAWPAGRAWGLAPLGPLAVGSEDATAPPPVGPVLIRHGTLAAPGARRAWGSAARAAPALAAPRQGGPRGAAAAAVGALGGIGHGYGAPRGRGDGPRGALAGIGQRLPGLVIRLLGRAAAPLRPPGQALAWWRAGHAMVERCEVVPIAPLARLGRALRLPRGAGPGLGPLRAAPWLAAGPHGADEAPELPRLWRDWPLPAVHVPAADEAGADCWIGPTLAALALLRGDAVVVPQAGAALRVRGRIVVTDTGSPITAGGLARWRDATRSELAAVAGGLAVAATLPEDERAAWVAAQREQAAARILRRIGGLRRNAAVRGTPWLRRALLAEYAFLARRV